MLKSIRAVAIAGVLVVAVTSVRGDARQAAGQQGQAVQQAPPAGQQPADQQPATDPQQPIFRAGINFVRVDAIVTDRSGALVTDLKATDFEITEVGKPQAIET